MSDAPPTAGPARRVRPLFLLPVLLFGGLAALFAVRLVGGDDPARLPSAILGRPAPAVSLPPLPGLSAGGRAVPGFASSDLRSDAVTIVNVWASWCAPCRIEHPLLVALADEPGVRLVGLNYKDRPEAARRFLDQLGNPFARVGIDPDGRAGLEWGVYGVPETFVVGRDGTVRYKHVGPLTPDTLPAFLAQVRRAAAP